jgi:hypothetical protein
MENDARYARAFGALSAVVSMALINLEYADGVYPLICTIADLRNGLARAQAMLTEEKANAR